MTKGSWLKKNCDRSISQLTTLEKYFENLSKTAHLKMMKLLMRYPRYCFQITTVNDFNLVRHEN
ncbi:MAG: hypothetical protein KME11_16865 [Timaviella obliquedivisa GSE-PSE-MK23-08B]|nr:hypothetical protein [Timaviella obliquedivisa GSE-PSE-MK23-08B]